MADINWEECPAIERLPGQASAALVFVGTRIPVRRLFTNVIAGGCLADFLERFPMDEWKPRAVLDYLAKTSRGPATDGTADRQADG